MANKTKVSTVKTIIKITIISLAVIFAVISMLVLTLYLSVQTPGNTVEEKQFLNAAQSGNIEVVKKCLASGLDINTREDNIFKWSALHGASASGNNYKLVEFLLNKGADVNARDGGGLTPLDHAVGTPIQNQLASSSQESNLKTIITLLRKHGGKTSEELKAEGK